MSKPSAAQRLAADLAVLAKAATPGPWVADGDHVNEHGYVTHSYVASGRRSGGRIAGAFANCLVKTDEQCRANAAFIAGANPKAVLVLTREIDRMTKIAYAAHGAFRMEILAERDQLKAENEALRDGANFRAIQSLRADCAALREVLADCINSLEEEMLQKFGRHRPDDMHPVTRREYDRDMAEIARYRAA